ncbi:SagB family peptide dehydrogenase [Actinomadura oligospora]|uniref:SagB family peptide dehydrogenase n=1 Tax=Actinomadura oligospora TaxID=111804 RepID=UPI0004BBAE64|nr:SagB family peptide dehydrogenase [Actinomadura oligospora]
MTGTDTAGAITEHLSLVPGVYSATAPDGSLRLLAGSRGVDLGSADEWKRDLLRRLAARPCQAGELATPDGGGGGGGGLLNALRAGGWLRTELREETGEPLYALLPTGPQRAPAADTVPNALALSPFAVIRRERDGSHLVVESPLAQARAHLHDPALLGLLDGSPGPLAERIRQDLYQCGLAEPVGADGHREFHLRQWSAHELWFHQRSRIGRRDQIGEGYGRTRWAAGLFEPLPDRPDPYPGPVVELPVPDLAELRRRDPTLAAVVEDRRSVRVHDDDAPITLEQLGEFLYRCARMRTTVGHEGGEASGRPYPSGGSVYELELYPVVRLASGVPAGVYHYDGHDHLLRLVQEPGPGMSRLLATARQGTFERLDPQVLFVVTARFGRLMWTYEQMPYSLVLKHVGVLYQTMYLAATAMGLAACGLGGGDRRTLNEMTGTPYTAESAVGEFLLGSRPAARSRATGDHGPAAAS